MLFPVGKMGVPVFTVSTFLIGDKFLPVSFGNLNWCTQMEQLKTLPEIIGTGMNSTSEPVSFQQAAGMGATGGFAAIGRSMSNAVETQNHTVPTLISFLHKKVYETRCANKRAAIWYGRIVNKLIGENPYYVLLSGHHLIQCFNMSGNERNTENIQLKATYGIRLDIAEKILRNLKNQITG